MRILLELALFAAVIISCLSMFAAWSLEWWSIPAMAASFWTTTWIHRRLRSLRSDSEKQRALADAERRGYYTQYDLHDLEELEKPRGLGLKRNPDGSYRKY